VAAGRTRLDEALVERGLVETRSRARGLIMAARVKVDGQVVTKAGAAVAETAQITLLEGPRYVSRAGDKLANGLRYMAWRVDGESCLDVGASTGGFTDCLLDHGAVHVVALDVGRHQLHERLADDPRVTVIDGHNARALEPGDLPYRPTFVTVDVSFISLRLVLPAVLATLADAARGMVLVKPQFEAGRRQVARGVVRDPQVHRQVLRDVCASLADLGAVVLGICDSCVRGPAGNREFLVALQTGPDQEQITDVEDHIANAVDGASGPADQPH
jgi:23S rRNA (cytidine1920-2'-O)/16S rRNA (cytidine1409-2'-O)-methyltransferase